MRTLLYNPRVPWKTGDFFHCFVCLLNFFSFSGEQKWARSERLRKRFRKKETPKNCSSTAGYLTGDQHANSEVKYPPSNKLLFYLLIGVKYMKKEREDYGIVLILSTPLPSSP